MPNKNYLKGYRFERSLVNKFRKLGLFAARTAGSHTPFDIIYISNDTLYLIQCKSGQATPPVVEEAKKKCPAVPDVLKVKRCIITENETIYF